MNDDAMPCRRCGGSGQEPDRKPVPASAPVCRKFLSLDGCDCDWCADFKRRMQEHFREKKPRTPAEVLELREWPNQGCCELNWKDQPCDCLEEAESKPRTPAEVIRLRTEGAMYGGCCNRFADNHACNCLSESLRHIGCGVQGQDLECVGCGEKLYGQQVVDVCPYQRR